MRGGGPGPAGAVTGAGEWKKQRVQRRHPYPHWWRAAPPAWPSASFAPAPKAASWLALMLLACNQRAFPAISHTAIVHANHLLSIIGGYSWSIVVLWLIGGPSGVYRFIGWWSRGWSAEGPFPDEDLPPQHRQAGPHLPRHPEGQVVARHAGEEAGGGTWRGADSCGDAPTAAAAAAACSSAPSYRVGAGAVAGPRGVWSLQIRHVLLSIQALMSAPNPGEHHHQEKAAGGVGGVGWPPLTTRAASLRRPPLVPVRLCMRSCACVGVPAHPPSCLQTTPSPTTSLRCGRPTWPRHWQPPRNGPQSTPPHRRLALATALATWWSPLARGVGRLCFGHRAIQQAGVTQRSAARPVWMHVAAHACALAAIAHRRFEGWRSTPSGLKPRRSTCLSTNSRSNYGPSNSIEGLPQAARATGITEQMSVGWWVVAGVAHWHTALGRAS